LSRVAVFDPEINNPVVLTNPEEGTPYWHSAIAFDKETGELVVGQRAREIVRLIFFFVSCL
jgi:hypothetical protein